MATVEERVSRLEGAYGHLATKADLNELKADLRGDLLKVSTGLAGMSILSIGVVATIVRFLG